MFFLDYCINQVDIIHECKQDLQFLSWNINGTKTFIYFMQSINSMPSY